MSKKKHHRHKGHVRGAGVSYGVSAFGIYGVGNYFGGYPGYADGGGTAQAPLNPDQFTAAAPSADAGSGTV